MATSMDELHDMLPDWTPWADFDEDGHYLEDDDQNPLDTLHVEELTDQDEEIDMIALDLLDIVGAAEELRDARNAVENEPDDPAAIERLEQARAEFWRLAPPAYRQQRSDTR